MTAILKFIAACGLTIGFYFVAIRLMGGFLVLADAGEVDFVVATIALAAPLFGLLALSIAIPRSPWRLGLRYGSALMLMLAIAVFVRLWTGG